MHDAVQRNSGSSFRVQLREDVVCSVSFCFAGCEGLDLRKGHDSKVQHELCVEPFPNVERVRSPRGVSWCFVVAQEAQLCFCTFVTLFQ